MLTVACTALYAALMAAAGGETIKVTGVCPPFYRADKPTSPMPAMTISRYYPTTVTIDATEADVAGVVVTSTGGNIVWKGGTIRAAGGTQGFAGAGYGVFFAGKDVRFQSVTFTDAKKGFVTSGGSGLVILRSRFSALREDGIIASRTTNVDISSNLFVEFAPNPTRCTFADSATITGLSSRGCAALAGLWIDGDHSDAIQLRNGMADVLVSRNTIMMNGQGIGQMDSPSDLPINRVFVQSNYVRVSGYHSITFSRCEGCAVTENDVASTVVGRKTLIRFVEPQTRACGNKAPNGGKGLQPC